MNPTTSSSGVATLDKKNLGRIAQIIGPMERDKTFPCPCGKGNVVRRTARTTKHNGQVYYACPDLKPMDNVYGCRFFVWEKAGTGSSSSPGPSTPSSGNRFSSSGLGEAHCTNCKLLTMKIKVLQTKLDLLTLSPKEPSQSTAAVHELIASLDKVLLDD
ncbi:hypothetical protein QVD17_08778 [Tagetes erecta]|uniref:GRF-type domain-containing protein n=1 Tax=Tagetes erecta TaxID=13708 RepID=A0AAD8KYA2_TARER|nr:hypothetical protein QVD17_08778 [Tagetes erecta]